MDINMDIEKNNQDNIDYAKYLAGEAESRRRMKIVSLTHTVNEEKKQKRNLAIASGVFFAGVLASIHFSGIDPEAAVELELKAMNSLEHLKEYLGMLTPAIYATVALTTTSLTGVLKHGKKLREAQYELDLMNEITPENSIYNVDSRMKGR